MKEEKNEKGEYDKGISHEDLFGADHPLLKDRKEKAENEQDGGDGRGVERIQIMPGSGGVAEKLSPEKQQRGASVSKSSKILDYVFRGALYLVVFLTPLFFFASSDVFGFAKSVLVSVLALIILASWAGKIISSGQFTWRSNWFFWSVAAIGVVVFLSNLFSSSFWVSFLGNVGRHDFATVTILSYIVIFFAIVQNIQGKEIIRLVWLAIASAAVAVLSGLLQFSGAFIFPGEFTKNKFFSPVGSIFFFCLFVASFLPLVTALFSRTRDKRLKVGLAILGVASVIILLLVNFKTAWLLVAISSLSYLLITIIREGLSFGEWQHNRQLGIPLFLLIIGLLFWIFPNTSPITISGIPAEVGPSMSASFSIVKGSWSENFLLGNGPETFPYEYGQYKSANLNNTNFWGINFNNSSSEILTWLSNLGLLGAIVWLIFVGWFLWIAIRELRRNDSGLLLAIFTSWVFIVASKFFYPTNITLELFFWILPAIFWAKAGEMSNAYPLKLYKMRTGSLKTLAVFVISLVLLVASLGGLYLSYQRWSAERVYASVVRGTGTPETRDDRVDRLRRAASLNPYVPRYWQTLSQALVLKVEDIIGEINARQANATEPQLAQTESVQIQRLTAQAFGALQQARQLDRENVSLLIGVAETYKRTNSYVSGANDLAIEVYEQTIDLEPVNPFLRTQLSQLYLIKDNFFTNLQAINTEFILEAKDQLTRVIELSPNYSNARYFLGFILDREGNRAGALEQFERVLFFNRENQAIQIIVGNLRAGRSALGPPRPPQPETAPVETDEAQGRPLE